MIVPAGLAATFIANEEDIVSRPTHVTWEERATSGNDARFDADSAVLVASKQKAGPRSRSTPRRSRCGLA